MCKYVKNNKGVTLLEIIISLAIVGLLLTLTFNLFFFGNEVFAKGSEQYNVQTSVRLSTTSITDTVRYSTALFIESNIPDTFENPYHYIYYDNGSVYYNYIDIDGTRKTRVLGTDITSLTFNKQSNRLIGMSINGVERNQSYQINMDIGLPNMEMKNNDVFGTTGSALKFQKDGTITNLSSSNEVRLNRETNFNMFNGDEFLLVANKDVDWSIHNGTGLTILSTTARTVKIQATGSIGDIATIRATSSADSTLWRQVSITIVPQVSSVMIVKSDGTEIPGSLNLVKDTSQELMVIIDPPLGEGIEVLDIIWSGAITGVYAFKEDLLLAPDHIAVTGQNVGGLADLTVSIELSDGTKLYDTIIINVSSNIEYAKLIDLKFDSTPLTPAFDPDILSYTVSGNGNQELIATSNTGSTVDISPLVNKYNLSQTFTIYVTVSEEGKISRTYTISN